MYTGGMKKFALLLCLFATACKREIVLAHVNCVTKEDRTVSCTVQQTKGKSEMDVCWDFNVKCANAATLTAHGCATVKDGGTVTMTIPAEKVTINGTCDADPKAEVVNMTINGDKAAPQK